MKEVLSDMNVVNEDDDGKATVVHYNQVKKVPAIRESASGSDGAVNDDEVATRKSQRQRRTPARLADFDLSTGSNVN